MILKAFTPGRLKKMNDFSEQNTLKDMRLREPLTVVSTFWPSRGRTVWN